MGKSGNNLSRSQLFTLKDGTLYPEQSPDGAFEEVQLADTVIDNKYQIIGLLGVGGMGAVYHARHLLLNKEMALKTFRSESLTQEELLRFQREAQAIAKLNHKNIVQVFDFGLSEDGMPYYTMEFLSGQSLLERLEECPFLPMEQAVDMAIQVSQGLALAHSKGVIHRDIKPGNIFLEDGTLLKGTTSKSGVDTPKIVDFGLASLTTQSLEMQKLTTVGKVFGSPPYMSPEQSCGKLLTASTDIYSLGCTLFEALTGRPPFVAKSVVEMMEMHQDTIPPTLRVASGGRAFPDALEKVVAQMLGKYPKERQPGMEEVAEQLEKARKEPVSVSLPVEIRVPRARHSVEVYEPLTERAGGIGRGVWIVGGIFALLGAVSLAYFSGVLSGGGASDSTVTASSPAASGYRATGGNTAASESPPIGVPVATGSDGSRPSEVDQVSVASGVLEETKSNLFTVRVERTTDGIEYVCLKVHEGIDPGEFKLLENLSNRTAAPGEIWWKVASPPVFEPSESFMQKPSNFAELAPLRLHCLDLRKHPIKQNGAEIMQQIGRLKDLTELSLDGSKLADADIASLWGLANLVAISVNGTGVSGASMAALPQLQQLVSIDFDNCVGVGDLLAGLTGTGTGTSSGSRGSSIRAISLSGDKLAPADIKALAELSGLTSLAVNYTGITDGDLLTLSALTDLSKLEAVGCHITSASVKTLAQMRRNELVSCTLSGSSWSQHDRDELKNLIPGVVFVDEKGGSQSAGQR
jgi:serine/threonine protein kinase